MAGPARSTVARRGGVVALGGVVAFFAVMLVTVVPVAAHGTVEAGPPDLPGLLFGWTWAPELVIPILVSSILWVTAVRRVNRAHPANPVPPFRSAAFFAGLFAIAIALMSGIERYDTTLFSVHMVQHILLMLVAAPLLALAAPITLLLRVSSHETRTRWILPILHSRVMRAVSFPVVAWFVFAGVMWGAHFSPLFEAALEDPLIHQVEHVLFLGAALLFWWPAIAADPSPWRMSHPARALYTFLQMPQNTFLSVAILSAQAPLYEHYATLVRPWGPTPLADQQMAAGIMWLVGDMIFLAAILGLVAAWMRHEEQRTAREDRRADTVRAERLEREARLAERVANER